MRDNTKRIKKIKNNTFAIHAAIPTITINPKTPAAIAIIRKAIAHINIGSTSFF
jgi:hypothetical protein